MENLEIDYLFNGYLVAYIIKTWNQQGRQSSYSSPFVFENTEDAYHAACIEISGK